MESWTGSVTADADGRILINHGVVDSMSCYDGYRFSRLPSPIPFAKVFSDSSGDLWTVYAGDTGGFQRFHDGRWEKKIIGLPGFKSMLSFNNRFPFLPTSQGKIYYLLPDSLMIFDYDTGISTLLLRAGETPISRFIDMIRARDGGLWITGWNGIVKCAPNMGHPHSPPEWEAFPLPGAIKAENPGNPVENDAHEVFVVADSRRTGKKILLIFDGASWRQMDFSVPGIICAGWRGIDRSIWLRTTVSEAWNASWNLFRFEDDHIEIVKKNRVLSGFFLDMEATSDGCFWIATSSGLARYSHPTWRIPPGLPDIRRIVHYSFESNDGSIFFGMEDSLLVLRGDKWETILVPEPFRPWKIDMCMLDGRKLVFGSRGNKIVYYDTVKKVFGAIQHPLATEIFLIQQRGNDSAWVYLQTPAGDYRIEILKNDQFEPFPGDINANDSGSSLWEIHTATNGDTWFLETSGLNRYHDGYIQKFGPEDGYTMGGAFCFLERNDGKIWIGGRDMIQEFDGSSWTTVKSTDLETVRSLTQCSDGSIIAGSGTGIHRFFQDSWIAQTFEDGLPDAIVYKVFEDRAHRIWACTAMGISLYYPESDVYPPETYITPQDTRLEVTPGGNGRIGFYGADKWEYTLHNRLLFSWRIDSGPWLPFQQVTSASFSGLSAGRHRFEVRSIDRNLNIDSSPAMCEFVVLTPWYRATGFLVIFSLGCTAILSLIVYAVSRHVLLEKLVIKRTASLQSEISERMSVEEKYRTLFETSLDALDLVSPKGTILDVNKAWLNLFGYTRGETVGKNIGMIYAHKDDSVLIRNELLNKGYIQDREMLFVTKDGGELTCNVTGNVRFDGDGNIMYFQIIIRDITERKKLEARLFQSQKMEAIGTLAGGIAHDFNNILTAIIGYAELVIMETPEGSTMRSDMEKILAAGNRARGVVDQILIFSRKQETKNVPLRISPILKESLKFLRASLPSYINIVQNIEYETGYVVANPSNVHQIIMNLCTNAAHAMKKDNEGTLTVQFNEITLDDDFVSGHPGLTRGRYARLIVSDTGYGMTQDVQQRIFEPYFTTKSQGEGTGLGLSIIHGIVTSLKGIITVYSEPGKGSTFNVYLPLTDQNQEVTATEKAPDYSGSGHILFVDDEPDIVEIGTRILKSLGYDVTAMTNSVDALDFFRKNHEQIDLVISDMTMPVIPGDKLARGILDIRPDIPIIICTGFSERLSKEEALAMGIREYLGKPLLKSEMAEKIHKILTGKSEQNAREDKE
ncbi:PAS domain S-box protein [bacterium]|nr:PAS domain S-box protein [bacterium]